VTRATIGPDGMDPNQQALLGELERVRLRLEALATAESAASPASADSAAAPRGAAESDDDALHSDSSALNLLCAAFGLSPFERDLVLLCAGIELDSAFAAACAAVQGGAYGGVPTFGLALAALDDPHWSALGPDAPLRRWRILDLEPGGSLTRSPLRLDERVLHHLAGIRYLDDRLAGMVEPVGAVPEPITAHEAVAERAAAAWTRPPEGRRLPVIQLCGADPEALRSTAAATCAVVGLDLHVARASAIPVDPRERDGLARLWEREAALSGSALLIEVDADAGEDRRAAALDLLERTSAALLLGATTRWRLPHRSMAAFDVPPAPYGERLRAWREALGVGDGAGAAAVGRLAAQFELPPSRIRAACAAAVGNGGSSDAIERAWEAGRREARPRLESLAQRIESRAGWDDLVLPDAQLATLREVALQVEHRPRVYDAWGFAEKSDRGLGISALFAGPSGTGKTMAAEVLARDLRLDLYRIDLSQVVNKYIGETEKNLRRVFDAAEEGGAVLFFDEADSLFGKRSEVRDSHDRYANIEVSYLLQRMEAYRGLAILATNLKDALDPAFLRRIRFVVHFPFPDAAHRAEIWRRIFPAGTPTAGLDVAALARLNVAGGSIRNIALNAAFLAAADGAPVEMRHLARSARGEYAKLEKALTEAELAGWNGGGP
jgi:hypothetical protein